MDRERLGEPAAARRQYLLALERVAGYSPAGVSLAVMDLRQGRFDGVSSRLEAVLARNPYDERARFFLAACFLAAERFPQASEHLKDLVRSRTFRPGALLLLGASCSAAAKPRRPSSIWKNALGNIAGRTTPGRCFPAAFECSAGGTRPGISPPPS